MFPPVCLICDEEMLIAFDVETCLQEIGVAAAGPFASGADALDWIATNRPDVAVLDCMLKDGACLPLISALQEQQVPIVIHSGWKPDEVRAPEIKGLPWISKPMDYNTMLKVLTDAAPQIILPESMEGMSAIVRAVNGREPVREIYETAKAN